jgi:hypothetical protein
MPYGQEIKAIKLLQERSERIEASQEGISLDLLSIKQHLLGIGADATPDQCRSSSEIAHPEEKSPLLALPSTPLAKILEEAKSQYPEPLGLASILSVQDFADAEAKIDEHVRAFNRLRKKAPQWSPSICVRRRGTGLSLVSG